MTFGPEPENVRHYSSWVLMWYVQEERLCSPEHFSVTSVSTLQAVLVCNETCNAHHVGERLDGFLFSLRKVRERAMYNQ